MSEKLYGFMDWPRIEAIAYGEENRPREILGPHMTEQGVLIQCFMPGVKSVKVRKKNTRKNYLMSLEDEMGFYAVLLPDKKIPAYEFLVEHMDKSVEVTEDAYRFPSSITLEDEKLFMGGIHYDIYKKLGAHPMNMDGVDGVYFAVWAPNALRVSVVGEFNQWNGKLLPMNRLEKSGIYELFVPQAKPGDLYKYELLLKGGAVCLRTDPFAGQLELRPGTAAVVTDGDQYTWNDKAWMRQRGKNAAVPQPLCIYELNLQEWYDREEEKVARDYRELAVKIASQVKDMGYTHVELMPVMEYPEDSSRGYGTLGYFAPTSRFGSCRDFMYFVDFLHQEGIGVILDWQPGHFPQVEGGLANYDGTCLWENPDPRQGVHPKWGTRLFNYGSPQTKNFLIAAAFYWAGVFHVDGLRMEDVDVMLYLDYGRNYGEWVPNIYGSNENLEAVEFLKHLNSVFKKAYPDVLLIAQEDGLWPDVTGEVDETHMGFDYKWSGGWTKDFLEYLHFDPIYRGGHHDQLTLSMVYAYCENFILTLGYRDIGSVEQFLGSLPGTREQQLAAAKTAFGYLMTHPGKKMLYTEEGIPQELRGFLQELTGVYKGNPALYQLDDQPEGFEWIQLLEYEKNIITFLRKTENPQETVMVLCNFSALSYEEHQIGVPYPGKYKEILNSDQVRFGGGGYVNPRVKMAKKEECNERDYSIKVKVAPLSISVFTFSKAVDKVVDNLAAKKKNPKKGKPRKNLKAELEAKVEEAEENLEAAAVPKVKSGKAKAAEKPGNGSPKKKAAKGQMETVAQESAEEKKTQTRIQKQVRAGRTIPIFSQDETVPTEKAQAYALTKKQGKPRTPDRGMTRMESAKEAHAGKQVRPSRLSNLEAFAAGQAIDQGVGKSMSQEAQPAKGQPRKQARLRRKSL